MFVANRVWSPVAGSRPSFLALLSKIFYFCYRGDLEHVSQDLNLGFTTDAHKYSSFVCRGYLDRVCQDITADFHKKFSLVAGAIWCALPKFEPRFYGGRSQILFFIYCRGYLDLVCRDFTAVVHKNSSLVAGAIWGAFAGIWTYSFHGWRSQIFSFCCRGDLERFCRIWPRFAGRRSQNNSSFVGGVTGSAFSEI